MYLCAVFSNHLIIMFKSANSVLNYFLPLLHSILYSVHVQLVKPPNKGHVGDNIYSLALSLVYI